MNRLVNFRDLGGLKTTEGKRIHAKRLLRSIPVDGLNDEDINFLKEYNIKLVVDFRSDDEIKITHNSNVLGNHYERIDIIGESSKDYGGYYGMMKTLNSNNVEEFMHGAYSNGLVDSPPAKLGYSKFLKLCLDIETGAVLFHCTHGKDRTGFAAALILKILGVSDDDIFNDYLKSVDELANEMTKKVAEFQQNGVCEEVALVLCGIKREYLESSFDSINQKYGNVENYVINELGITQEDIIKLKSLYLE